MVKEKLWSRNFVCTVLSLLFTATVFYIYFTTMTGYAIYRFDVDTGMAGFVASIFIIGTLIGRIFTGQYFELVGRKRLLIIGNIAFLVFGLLYFLPLNLEGLLIVRLLHGLSFGTVNNMLQTIVIDYIPKSRLGEGIGYSSLSFVFATGVGPFVGMFFIQNFSYNWLFLFCALLSVAAFIMIFTIDIKVPKYTGEQLAKFKVAPKLTNIFEKKALPLGLLVFIVTTCYTSMAAFIEQYSAVQGMSHFAPYFFVLYCIFVLIIRPHVGKLLDQKGDNFVMYPAIILFALCLAVYSFADSVLLYVLAALLLALGFGNLLSVAQAIVTKSVEHYQIGKATSTYFFLVDLGYAVGPVIMGVLASWQGFNTMYLIEAGIALACLVYYYAVHGRFARRKG